jgi:hypothetical protein
MRDKVRLLIATHTYGSVTPAYCYSLALSCAYLAASGIIHSPVLFEDPLVDRGRNRAAATFLESDFTHLLFVDADIDFKPEAIVALLATGKEFVVGGYRKKDDRDDYCIAFLEADYLEDCAETGCLKIARAGTGFMLIARRVFEAMREAMPEIAYQDHYFGRPPRDMWEFFSEEVRDRRHWSEDYVFCNRWRALGGDIWLHPEIKLGHWGPRRWPGDIMTKIYCNSDQIPAE